MTLIPPDMREVVAQRAGNRCEYCHLSQESQVATFPVDHVLPTCLGGKTEFDNLALSCPRCNSRKWIYVEGLDPETGQMAALFNPRTQTWTDHFRWSGATLVPLTAVGRATVALLDLNALQFLTIRNWLITLGMPPSD